MRFVISLAGAAFVALFAAEGSLAEQSSSDRNQTRTNAKGEKLICHRVQETGSLARRRTQCFTKAQWDRIAEAARVRGERLATGHTSAGEVSN